MNLIGLDLGKTIDPSACSIFTRRLFVSDPLPPLPPKPEVQGPKRPPMPPGWDLVDTGYRARQAAEERRFRQMNPFLAGDAAFDEPTSAVPELDKECRYLCRMLKKWPLGTSYVSIVRQMRELCGHPRMQLTVDGEIQKPTLIVDATGLGAPVVDMFVEARVPAHLIAITITGGDTIRIDEDRGWHWFVPKHILVMTLHVLIQSARIDFPPRLKDPVTKEDMQAALMKELKDFQEKQITGRKTGKVSTQFEAEDGSHDDLLMSACYCVFWGERGGRTPKVWT